MSPANKESRLDLRRIERRNWQLWVIAILIIVFLTVSIIVNNFFQWYAVFEEKAAFLSIQDLKTLLKQTTKAKPHSHIVLKIEKNAFAEKLQKTITELNKDRIKINLIVIKNLSETSEFDEENVKQIIKIAENENIRIIPSPGLSEEISSEFKSTNTDILVNINQDGDITISNIAARKARLTGYKQVQIYLNFLFFFILLLCVYLIQKWRELNRLKNEIIRNNQQFAVLNQRYTDLENFFEITSTINSKENVAEIFDTVVEKICKALIADQASLMRYDAETNELRTVATYHCQREEVKQARIPLGKGIAGWVAKNAKPLLITPETDFDKFEDFIRKDYKIFSAISAPLIIQQNLIGVLNVNRFTFATRFTRPDLRMVEVFANNISSAINNIRLIQRLKASLENLRKTQSQLIQVEKLSSLGELVAGISHEIVNPLATIKGYCELVSDRSQDEFVVSSMKKNISQIDRCQKILRSLLNFSRQYKGQKEPADINAVVRDVLDFLQPQVKIEKIFLTHQLDENIPEVYIDKNQMQQVLLNIINNARHAVINSDEKKITVESGTIDKKVWVSIADTGGGIPRDAIGKIFDPFFTTKEAAEGTGLGLSICYGIVREHDGTITAENLDNIGAKFTIELPVIEK